MPVDNKSLLEFEHFVYVSDGWWKKFQLADSLNHDVMISF